MGWSGAEEEEEEEEGREKRCGKEGMRDRDVMAGSRKAPPWM